MTSSEKDVTASNETEAPKDSATVSKDTENKETSTESVDATKAEEAKPATKKASTAKKATKEATEEVKTDSKEEAPKAEATAERATDSKAEADKKPADEKPAAEKAKTDSKEEVKAESEIEEAPKAVTEPTDAQPEFKLPDFSGTRSDVVYTFEQLQASSDDYTEEEFGELVTMYENTLSRIEEKEIVKGVVLAVDPKYVIVDIGFKSEGIVPINEFSASLLETLAPGDEVEVFLDKVEDREGQLILSRKKADILLAWEKIESAHETGEIVEGFIKRRIKGGMVVDLYGIDAFLPGSQIDVRPVRDFDAYVEKTMELQVVKLNMQAENVVVSHRSLIESDLEDKRQEILETIEKGQVLEGAVKNITDFGVFIDLGGVDGLLHITDLSHGRVDHPSEILSLDQKLNVVVIDFDSKSKRVSLGLKQLQPHPWDEIHSKYPEESKVQGRVVSIADYGAFVELEKGVEGLIHISEMSWTQHIKHPSQLVEKGQIVECIVLNVDDDGRKISLGIKQLVSDPWEDLHHRFPIGSKHNGVVRNLTNFGAFVELESGIDGLVHVTDLSWTKKIDHPSEVVSKGQELEVVVSRIDVEKRQISLSHKETLENPWDKALEELNVGAEITGTIYKVTDNGLFLNLPIGIEAFIGKNRLAEQFENLPNAFKEGSELTAKIFEFDGSSKTLELSQLDKDFDKSKPKPKPKKEKSPSTRAVNNQVEAATLGEMSGLADKLAELQEAEKEDAKAKKVEEDKEEKESKPASKVKKAPAKKTAANKTETKEEDTKAEEAPEAEASESTAEADSSTASEEEKDA
ncbi:MAG: 30S ribosomal protein S1 [Rhodothermaceae bacterium TMED105]|nr:MAG: 30S ribosomal protein S1 [Rhodothermaceae bacterium TMED105]|tara:strand:- start:9032 stop:11446 length:2415 start_codon:yes stop_codon:yes gene_type:complete